MAAYEFDWSSVPAGDWDDFALLAMESLMEDVASLFTVESVAPVDGPVFVGSSNRSNISIRFVTPSQMPSYVIAEHS